MAGQKVFTEKMQQKEVKSLVFTNTKIGINLEHPREESTYRWIHEPELVENG